MDGLRTSSTYEKISVTPASPNVGAEISNINLTLPLPENELAELKRAFLEFGVLFFRDQEISFQDHARLGEYFGSLGEHVGVKTTSKVTDDPRVRKFHTDADSPAVSGNVWHTDQSCAEKPPKASILYLHTIPPNSGGDTGFASLYAAYEGLSERLKTYLDGLIAFHDGRDVFGEGTPHATHPLICRHPETGRKLIYFADSFTTRIQNVSREESDMIIKFLSQHCSRVEWSMRFHWRPHSIAFWDNRCVIHRAIGDYLPHARSGFRVQLEGETRPSS